MRDYSCKDESVDFIKNYKVDAGIIKVNYANGLVDEKILSTDNERRLLEEMKEQVLGADKFRYLNKVAFLKSIRKFLKLGAFGSFVSLLMFFSKSPSILMAILVAIVAVLMVVEGVKSFISLSNLIDLDKNMCFINNEDTLNKILNIIHSSTDRRRLFMRSNMVLTLNDMDHVSYMQLQHLLSLASENGLEVNHSYRRTYKNS